ncbi:hypothetical protein [Pedobacter mendelii]|uniref:Lipoprotein n=1 Tax=Pedobacter mendelii TaxID=1908240 RepID=A0ABQ2BIX5_9SPHI|nr:hypothetical protein [Pedobacter mendelii]GGI27359.1 hypothetical protein GCM10008119_27260 [Pedobacter mendelii]
MNKLFLIIAIISILMTSCQSDSKKYTTVDSSIMSEKQTGYTAPDECFEYVKDKSTASLRMYGTGDNKVLGELNYKFDGKDKNNGVIYGLIKGDTIIVDYKFQSEGMYSHREVAWLRKGDQLIEGYGDVYQVNGDTKFKNINKLTFGKSIILSKTNCK